MCIRDRVKAARKWKGKSQFGPGVLELCALADVVFLALHGQCGEDGRVQAAFDQMCIRDRPSRAEGMGASISAQHSPEKPSAPPSHQDRARRITTECSMALPMARPAAPTPVARESKRYMAA